MATSFPSSPLPVLLITILSLCFHLHVSSVDSNITSRDSTIQYWNHKVPNNVPHSDFLLSLLSPLPGSLSSFLSSPLTISPSLCHSARLLCPNITFFQSLSSIYYTSARCFYHEIQSACPSGLLFRESELKEGKVMLMPDIRDKMPVRSFLPRSIANKIPFESDAIKSLFRLEPNTTLEKAVDNTLVDCRTLPSQGETKRCTTSAEDMIDFAVEMLGNDIMVRITESPNGYGRPILIGKVNEINGGKISRSVSCHQKLFPYMVYYCHTVSRIRVYEVEILSIETKKKINKAIAICHLATFSSSARNPAFLAVSRKPGRIEVCHWLFNGDIAWVIAGNS